jgi:3',5'-cyclic AMP phosphodiesterase CpdA
MSRKKTQSTASPKQEDERDNAIDAQRWTESGRRAPRIVAHLSDLHFGADDAAIVSELADDVSRLSPHVVVVSGDVTQRASRRQFISAGAFLDRLPVKPIIVPGNHDIAPLHRPIERALRPLEAFARHLGHLDSIHSDEAMLIVGLDTTAPFRWKEGRIGRSEEKRIRAMIAEMEGDLGRDGDERIRIAFMHHPNAVDHDGIRKIDGLGIDVILAGHAHTPETRIVSTGNGTTILSRTGTGCSRRRRGQPNAYGVLFVEKNSLSVETRAWTGRRFETTGKSRYLRCVTGWRPHL